MEDLNKITSTRVGDSIHFFVNGTEDKGTVVKMDSKFVTVVKDDGNFQDIHINDTFFIKDIIVNKSWNDMTMEERTVELHKVHAYSPRFLGKSWQELPQELKTVLEKGNYDDALPDASASHPDDRSSDERVNSFSSNAATTRLRGMGDVLTHPQGYTGKLSDLGDAADLSRKKKSNVEQGHLGGGGRSSQVVETNTDFDAPDDYEGQTEDEKKEQFKHEDKKPQTTDKSMQEQLWEEWLSKDGGMGSGSAPAVTSSNNSAQTNDSGMYNPVYGEKGRHGGQGRDKEEDEDKEDKERKG